MSQQEQLGFQAQIYNYLEDAPKKITFPDRTNAGKILAALMLWKRINQISEKKYDTLLSNLIEEEVLKDPKAIKTPGVHVIGASGQMTVEVNVSKPRREFNMQWFVTELEKKHKVPQAVTLELFEKAKQEGQTQNRTITVKEKGVNI